MFIAYKYRTQQLQHKECLQGAKGTYMVTVLLHIFVK